MGTEPGELLGIYRTNNGRRGSVAVVLLVAGVVVTGAGIAFWVTVEDRAGTVATSGDPLALPAIVLGLGAGMLLMGVWAGLWFLSHRGEAFRLHEHGLVHRRASGSRTIGWDEIESVVVNQGKDNALTRMAGGYISCVIKPAEGGKVTITGLTENAGQLIERIRTAHEQRR